MSDNILENCGTALSTICQNVTVTGNKLNQASFVGYNTAEYNMFTLSLARIVNFHNNTITNVLNPSALFMSFNIEYRLDLYFTGNVIRDGNFEEFIKMIHTDDTTTDYIYMRNNTIKRVASQKWMDFSKASIDIQYNRFIEPISFRADASLFRVSETSEHGVAILNYNIFESLGVKYVVEMVPNGYSIGMIVLSH
jgi:hypothetical protein